MDGALLKAMGLTVGWITSESTADERRAAYRCDVTYASVNEIGFDSATRSARHRCFGSGVAQPGCGTHRRGRFGVGRRGAGALVLARTTHRETPKLEIIGLVGELVADSTEEYFATDDDSRNVHLTEAGAKRIEKALGDIDLYSEEHVTTTLTEVNVALHAHVLLQRDVHYIVRDGAVHLINSSRGRIAQLQRWPDGLQAAVEAKEDRDHRDRRGSRHHHRPGIDQSVPDRVRDDRYGARRRVSSSGSSTSWVCRRFHPIRPTSARTRLTGCTSTPVVKPTRSSITSSKSTRPGNRFSSARTTSPSPKTCTGASFVAAYPPWSSNAKNDEEEAQVIAEAGKLGVVTVSTRWRPWHRYPPGGSDAADQSAEHDELPRLAASHVIGTGGTERNDWTTSSGAGRAAGDPGSSVFFFSLDDDVVAAHLDSSVADRLRRDRAHRQSQSGGPARPRPASRRGPPIGRTREYLALQPADRPATLDHCRAPKRVAGTDTARTELKALSPERYEELSADLSGDNAAEDELERICRTIMLYHLDRGWADHLAYLSDIRESIHLRALGRQNPLDEFHRMAVDAFTHLAADAIEAAQQTFPKRPTYSWTNPAWTCPSWRVRRRRGRTWFTTTRSTTTRCPR